MKDIAFNMSQQLSEAEYEYDYSDEDEDYPVEEDDEEMDWEESNPNAAPVMKGKGTSTVRYMLRLAVVFYWKHTSRTSIRCMTQFKTLICIMHTCIEYEWMHTTCTNY